MALQLLTVNQQGLETDTSGWTANANCTISQTAAQARSGTKSLQLSSTAGGDMVAATTSNLSVMPGRTYTGSAYARSAVSTRSARIDVYWFQASGAASAIRVSDVLTFANDPAGSWTALAATNVVAPLDAFSVSFRAVIIATGAGAEVHYFDDFSWLDASAPFFKAGRTAEVLLNSQDVSGFFNSAELAAKGGAAPVDTFKQTWHNYIPDVYEASFTLSGYYDPTVTTIRATLGSASDGVLSYAPAGATAIGDQVRLVAFDASDYKEGSKVGGAIPLDFTVQSSAALGYGECLHVLGSESPATITGTGSPLGTGASSANGAVVHLHVTAYSAGTQNFKLQDATTLNGAYTDIASGAFPAVTAVGGYRLIIPGTIRAYVRCVATIATAAVTYSVSAARM